MRLIETKDILSCFSKNVEWATNVDIATAWATANDGLRKLEEESKRLKVRTVVGLWGNVTDPLVLRRLGRLGKLRVVGSDRCFHPKIFIFRNPEKSVAWVGSANFTSGGFGRNEEILLETRNAKAVETWFNRLWKRCGRLEDGAIDDYALRRKRNPPEQLFRPKGFRSRFEDGPLALLQGVTDWNDYVDALEQCDQWRWSQFEGDYSVLGETDCWKETIGKLHVVVNGNWERISDDEKKSMLGLLGTDKKWALLGRMRPAAFNAIFLDEGNLNTVKDAVSGVADAGDGDFPGVAIDAYEKMIDIEDIGKGSATRLLALARPDYLVSFNNESRTGLVGYLELPFSPTAPLTPQRYHCLLERLYEKPWFNSPRPKNPREGSIWSMRAALIDCFVYNGGGPG